MILGSMTSEVSAIAITAQPDGLAFQCTGGCGKSFGRFGVAVLIAACTAALAASISRPSSNWTVIWVPPVALNEPISMMPGMTPTCRSSGCANEVAIVSALAPGNPAQTPIVGRSTDGKAAIGI